MKYPISAWGGNDPRIQLLRDSTTYIAKLPVDGKTGFSEGVPDVSKFSENLAEVQDMPLSNFLEPWTKDKDKKYVEKLSFNPTKAKYFDMFMDIKKRPGNDHGTPSDFSLSKGQLACFEKNGFVVTGSQQKNWARAYYHIYNNDLPVLITADSILHAFHKSYDTFLQQFEMSYCASALMRIFNGMRAELTEVYKDFIGGPMEQSFKDVDFYLTVGMNLLNAEEYYHPGDENDPKNKKEEAPKRSYYYPPPEEKLKEQIRTALGGGNELVDLALAACKKEQPLDVMLFGKQRTVDFSLFKPRGHYTTKAALRQYFRAFSWLAKIDMIIAGDGSNIQQTGSAVVLYMLLTKNKKIEETFHKFNKTIEILVGPPNSMDARQLGVLLDQVFKMKNFASLNSEEALTKLQESVLASDLGKKMYNDGGWRSFTFIGQKFSIDSWAQSKFISNDDNPTANKVMWQGHQVHRHSTSSVEIAYAVLGNEDSVPVLHKRIADPNPSNKFRDGLMYHPYLVATKKTIDNLPAEAWSNSIYTYWLAALRKLSLPMDKRFPEAMRTQAFAMKKMGTQLGSWAQARHDNILYIEQLGRCMAMCEYPDGYVEPYVEFWDAMEKLSMNTVQAVSDIVGEAGDGRQQHVVTSAVKFFLNFAKHMRALRDISATELASQPLSEEQSIFIKTIVELQGVGSGGDTQWTGWYPSLFYGGEDDLDDPDLLVADTYTNPPSDVPIPDPGCVVHQGIGYPLRMLMAVNNGKNISAYAGPVYDYYEFELPGIERWNDDQWKEKVEKRAHPPPPEWTAAYLVAK